MQDVSAHIVAALLAAGMGVAFYVADPKAPTSRALALFLVMLGIAIAYDPVLRLLDPSIKRAAWIDAPDVISASLAFIAGFEWGLRVTRTIPDLRYRALGDWLVRGAQALVVVYCVAALALRDLYLRGFTGPGGADVRDPAFYLFAGPLLLALLLIATASALALGQRPDRLEGIRILSILGAGPFMAGALVLPDEWVPVSIALGLVIFLVGSIRYHVMQGERGQFLSRFLSPQVAQLVRERGLHNAMRTDRQQLSVVCCDVRGFTAYARETSPERVIQFLREYYRIAGEAVAQYGGTIKDQAGDGILILVGAPIAYADHARRAIELATVLRARVRDTLVRWSDERLRLGVGIGVASGHVAVGVIGDASRLEYTAVGPAVNLASRLCEHAADGEIRIDEPTLALAGRSSPARGMEPLVLKGFAQPVANYSV